MSREIKFRGKSIYGNIWVYGNLIHSKRFSGCSNEYRIHDIDTGLEHDVIPETVGQFTGLTDKNGKEIFEGDIIFNSNKTLITLPEDKRLYLVKWQDGKYNDEKDWLQYKPGFIFEKIKFNDKKYMDLIFGQHQIEIIGNIYDNPELP